MLVYVPARAALLGYGAAITYVRVTNIPPNRISYIQYTQGKQGQSNFSQGPDDYDFASLDLLIRMQDAIGKRRSFWMGAIPDAVSDTFQQGGTFGYFTNSAAWKQWLTAINTLNFGLRSIEAKGPPVTYQFQLLLAGLTQPIYTRKRNRGRPFGLPRGRRLA
jgi:hypothetical protein